MGEQCDDANDVETDDCLGLCTAAICGDGFIHDGFETCDDAGDSPSCDDDCTPAVCGDGHVNVQADETCDESGETATCDADCTAPQCGDGSVNQAFGEVCDAAGESSTCDDDCSPAVCGDGNTNAAAGEQCDTSGESATCDADCSTATCGDGQLNMLAGEKCDDGNVAEGDGCSSQCEPHKVVFATSLAFNGNLGGLVGADAQCQQLAVAAGIKGTFRAWLSDSTGSPSTRFTKSAIPYARRDGVVIANNWADLTDGFLAAAINLSEIKSTPGSDANTCGGLKGLALTDTATDGTLFNAMGTCLDWTSAAANQPTGGGHFSSANSNWSTYFCIYTCNWKKALYCFEQ
jgi:cysteine-rich repeat protein